MKYLLLFISSICLAGNTIELNEISITGAKLTGSPNDLMINTIPGRVPGINLGVDIKTTFMNFFYFNSLVHGRTDSEVNGTSSQFRTVGYKFEVGLRLTPVLDLEYGHHSRHTLDYNSPFGYQVEDYLGFRLYLFRDNWKPERVLFDTVR